MEIQTVEFLSHAADHNSCLCLSVELSRHHRACLPHFIFCVSQTKLCPCLFEVYSICVSVSPQCHLHAPRCYSSHSNLGQRVSVPVSLKHTHTRAQKQTSGVPLPSLGG